MPEKKCGYLPIRVGTLAVLVLVLTVGFWRALPSTGDGAARAQAPTLTPCAYLPLIRRGHVPSALTPSPTPIAWGTWQRGSGTDNARFYCLALDEVQGVAYAGGTQGVYRSTDQGRTWHRRGLNDETVQALLTTGPGVYAGVAHGGVYRSTDGGATWTAGNTGLSSLEVMCLLAQPDDPTTLYAGLYAAPGVARSTDGGSTWHDWGAGLHSAPLILSLAAHPVTTTILYAGEAGGVYSSTTGGASWMVLRNAPLDWIDDLGLDPADPQVVYAGQRGDWYGWPTGYRSADGGATWTTLPRGGMWAWGPDGLYCGTTEGVWRSADQGTAWAEWNEGLGDRNVRDLAADDAPTLSTHTVGCAGHTQCPVDCVYAATDDGVWWRGTTGR